MAYANVYTFGPTFRAEKSNTARHAAEFWMMEPEIAFADLEDDMQLAEDMLKYIIRHLMKNCRAELEFFNERVDKTLLSRFENIIGSDFGRVKYAEAVELLKKSGEKFEYPVEWGMDLQTEHERYLTEKVYGRPVFVTDWPRDIKAFYMRLNDDGETVAAMDSARSGCRRAHRRLAERGAPRLPRARTRQVRTQERGLLVVPRAAQVRRY